MNFLKWLQLGAVLFIAWACTGTVRGENPPNIVYIMSDGTGRILNLDIWGIHISKPLASIRWPERACDSQMRSQARLSVLLCDVIS